jgi:hypothetical protein
MDTRTATDVAVPDFTAEWRQITEDLESEAKYLNSSAECALRIGETLIKIRDELKPRGLWLDALRDHGWSQPQASRYIRFANLPERDREPWLRRKAFSLSGAVGERPSRKKDASGNPAADYSSTNSPEIPADELLDRSEEIDQRFKLAIAMIVAGERALAGEAHTEYADDADRWKRKLGEVADATLAVVEAHLKQELRQRLLSETPCR